jgi:hypothetical protein
MGSTKQLWYGFTDQEIEEKVKRESPEHKAQQERENRETDASRWERFKKKIAREEDERAEQEQRDADTLAAMSPERLAHYYATRGSEALIHRGPRLQKGAMMALEDVRRDKAQEANRQREAAEERAGIPKMQAASAARCEKIRDEADAEVADLDQRRRAVLVRKGRKLAAEEERLRAELTAARESLAVKS